MSNGPHYKASVIVPTFDRSGTVADSVHSLAAQTGPRDEFEVIVVDDGSHDDTFEAVTTTGAELNLKYLYQPDRGYRAARARNLGIAVAEGEICIFLDAGNLATSGFVAAHIAAHAAGPNRIAVGYIYGFFSTYDDQRVEDVQRLLDPRDVDGSLSRFREDGTMADAREGVFQALGDDLSKARAPWVYCFGGNVSAPTALIRKAGGWDENYQSWGDDDLDFALSLQNAGGSYVLCRDGVAIQTPHEKNAATRQASHRKNARYLHSKFNTPETALLEECGWRRMPLLPEGVQP